MIDIENRLMIDRAIRDTAKVLEETGVSISPPIQFSSGNVTVHVENIKTYVSLIKPVPESFDDFLNYAVDIHVQRNTDYDSRYMKALISEGLFIWKWEVDKKLDRIRTWNKRGELKSKGDGIINAVVDAFNYTVQAYIRLNSIALFSTNDPMSCLNERDYYSVAAVFRPYYFIDYLIANKMLRADEVEVRDTIAKYMGGGK